MPELTQDLGEIDAVDVVRDLADLLRITGEGSPPRGHEEPFVSEHPEGPLHRGGRDPKPGGQFAYRPDLLARRDGCLLNFTAQYCSYLLERLSRVIFGDRHALERTH